MSEHDCQKNQCPLVGHNREPDIDQLKAELETLKMRFNQCNTENQNVHKENLALDALVKSLEEIEKDSCGCDLHNSWMGCDCQRLRDKAKEALAAHERMKVRG